MSQFENAPTSYGPNNLQMPRVFGELPLTDVQNEHRVGADKICDEMNVAFYAVYDPILDQVRARQPEPLIAHIDVDGTLVAYSAMKHVVVDGNGKSRTVTNIQKV